MVLRQARTRRHVAWISAIALAIALFVAAGHRHDRHEARDGSCATCTVAHHSPTIASTAPQLVIQSEQVFAGIAPVAAPALATVRSLTSGRSPPLHISA